MASHTVANTPPPSYEEAVSFPQAQTQGRISSITVNNHQTVRGTEGLRGGNRVSAISTAWTGDTQSTGVITAQPRPASPSQPQTATQSSESESSRILWNLRVRKPCLFLL